MDASEIKALRKTLGLTTRALGDKLGVEQKAILSWEQGETFPTKKHVEAMKALHGAPPLQGKGPALKTSSAASDQLVFQALGDPDTWSLIRKILAHPDLRVAAANLARAYEDPG